MMWYDRFYGKRLYSLLTPNKVLVIHGPRRAGKTALIEHYLKEYPGKIFWGYGEDETLKEVFRTPCANRMRTLFSAYDLLVFDEAQKLPNVGTALKLIVDTMDGVRVIAGGSSSFSLSGQLGEPLTGRQLPILLYPLAVMELARQFGGMDINERLESLLIYGSYPECLNASDSDERNGFLLRLRDSYLYKDILELENIRNADKISDLLRMLAFQIGHQVSMNELGNSLGLAKQTVERYLDLLEKSFVIRKVRGFSQNLRKEVTKSARFYFWDNGVRNAVINNFNSLSFRDDVGMLWENFLFMEREKYRAYTSKAANFYFWRTYDRKELDLVEERSGRLYGYEFKWGRKKSRARKAWLEAYPHAGLETIDRQNFLDFIT